MKTNKRTLSLSALIFFGFIGLGAAAMLFLPKKSYSENEKRYLTEFPEITIETLADGSAQEKFEKWFSDAFPLREFWVGINAYSKLALGRNTQQEVYYADKDYLIRAPAILDQSLYTQNLERFENFAKNNQIPASMIIVPSSGYINEDLLPAGHDACHDDKLFALAEQTLSHIALCDVRDILREANQNKPVYYRTDHHLTASGCYNVYTHWREWLGRSVLAPEQFDVTSYNGFYGTTWSSSGYYLIPPDYLEIWDSGVKTHVTIREGGSIPDIISDSLYFREHLENMDKYPVYLNGNHPLVVIENPDAGEDSLLIIKDSYAHCFAPFLANHYRYIYMIDLRYYRTSVSNLLHERQISEILYFYGIDSLLTDSNSAWLM